MKGLTYTRLPWLLTEYIYTFNFNFLKLIFFLYFNKLYINKSLIDNIDEINSYELFDLLKYISKQPIGREIIWNFFRTSYSDLVADFGTDDTRLGQLLIDISQSFEDEFMFYEVYILITFFFYFMFTTADYLIFQKKIEFRRFSTIFSDFLIFLFIVV